MRTMRLMIVALTLMALIPVTGAFAAINCGDPNDLGGGNVEMMVTATNGNFNGVAAGAVEGGVVISLNDCAVGVASCTWSAQGVPAGPTPQSAIVAFRDGDNMTVECMLTDADGLPAELVEFSVN